MTYSWLGKDIYNIVGKNPEDVPECPAGYIYCPGCNKVAKLPGINNHKKVWFGQCKCGFRIIFRPEDLALAYVDNVGILHSHGFEKNNFSTYVGNHVKYPYA